MRASIVAGPLLVTVATAVLAADPDPSLPHLRRQETHQGRHVRLEPGRFSLQRVRLYAY